MKDNRNKDTRKTLLLLVSCALVVAISVGITMAYLTAKTNEKVNTFSASKGITGETLEPHYDSASNPYTIPGKKVNKDPLIQNTTADANIVVGAKVSFYINIGNVYQQVTQEVFSHYVDIKTADTAGMNITGTLQSDNSITGLSNTWIPAARPTGDTQSTYLIYDKILKQQTDGTITSGNCNPDSVSTYNDAASDGEADNTAPIFTSVTPKAELRIEKNGTGSTINGNEELANTIYRKFDYKIIVDAYAVKDDLNLSGSDDGAKITTAKSDILTGLQSITHTF